MIPFAVEVALQLAKMWVVYYVFIHILYYAAGGAIAWYLKRNHPELPTNRLSEAQIVQQKMQSEKAFPLYCLVPAVGDVFRMYGSSKVCYSLEECGGVMQSLVSIVVYLTLVEAGVFWIHYWWLHEFSWGKKNLNHALHHSHKTASDMNSWTGYAFEAVDGAAQGVPFVLFQFIVPVPYAFVFCAGAFVAIWTMYIHVGYPHAPWPLMGADYHYIHHIYNRYNYGLFTQFWDYMFDTLKHPSVETMKEANSMAFVADQERDALKAKST